MDKIKDRFSNFKGKPFRPGQAEAIRFVIDSGDRLPVIIGPTGSGKSLTGMCAGATHGSFIYLCSSKQLQRQLVEDFPEARLMMGRGNFKCNLNPSLNADHCTYTQTTPCKFKSKCAYEIHKKLVLAHPIAILNYSYFLSECNFVGRFSGRPLVVCDEADRLEEILTGFIEVSISRKRLETLGLNAPRRRTATASDGVPCWKQWAEREALPRVNARLDDVKFELEQLESNASPFQVKTLTEEIKGLEGLSRRLAIFLEHVDESWIFQETPSGCKFQPTWLTPALSRRYFFSHGQKFMFMSATFPPKNIIADTLGIPVGDLSLMEIPSSFPIENRPVFLQPVADMAFKNDGVDHPKLLNAIQAILDSHKGEKGVIHSVSYTLNNKIMGLNNPRLITHNATDKMQALERFSQSADGVFVSPSSVRGLNLPDSQCRFIILPKCPYESLADKLINRRVYGPGPGKYWYRATAAQSIVQATGRGVRHGNDHCVTYLLDRQIERLIVDNQNLFPRYWMEAVDYA